MPKPNKNKGSDLYRRAVRDVMLSFRPARRALRRERRQGLREYRQAQQRSGEAYDQLAGSLDQLNSQYQAQVAPIAGQLTSQIGALGQMLGTDIGAVPEAERAAGTGLVGTIGAGTLEMLASDAARNAAYGTSAARQGEIQRLTDSRNLAAGRRDFLSDIRDRRTDLMGGIDQLIRQRQDELTQQGFDRRMALADLAMARGRYGMDRAAFNTQQGYDSAIGAFLQQAMSDPDMLRELLWIGG